MATYVRQSSFSDGDTITSALFNNEFNQLVNAFNASSGHTHDGSTAGDGGPISNLFSNALVFGTNANTDVAITFNATTNDGVLTWMEDEDYFKFSDDLLIDSTEKVQFRDTGLYIYSSADGQLDIVADTEVQIAATTIDINGNADISGNLGIGGNLTVTGTTTFNGGTLTLGDSAADNVVFGADVDSNIIPDDDGAYDLGSSTQEWRDLYLDGTAHIDTLDVDVNATIAGTLGVTGVLTGTSLDISGDIDVDGTTNLDVVDIDGAVDMATTLAVAGNVDFNGDLDVDGTTNLDVVDIDGAVDMATTLAVAGNVDFNGDLDVDGTTNLDVVDIDGAVDMATTLTVGGEITAASLDISGNVDIDGTLETDALSLNGTTVTASATDINLIDGITNGTVIASKAIVTDANIDITGGRNITISGELDAATLDISGDADIDGTLEADAITVNGTALASVIAGTTVNTATVATTVTITDNENTNENNAIVFTAGGDLDGGNLGLESDGDLKYNPSTGTLSATNISVSGTLSTVDSVTMSANNAVVFEGATADAHETTLTSVDATADRTITLPNVSGTVPVLAAASNTQITSTPEELNILDGVTSTAAELNALDGITAVVGELNALDIGSTAVGTAVASKAVILDSNKDYTGVRNFTLSGELDTGSLDVSGDIDVDGTTNLDVVDIDGAVDMASTLGVSGVVTANAGVVVDEMTIDGDTLTATDEFIIDAASHIKLDADSGNIIFRDAGSNFSKIINSSGDVLFSAETQDKDIKFNGNDGGAAITALSLDMSDAGTATFNHDIKMAASSQIIGAGDLSFDSTNDLFNFTRAGGNARGRLESNEADFSMKCTLNNGDLIFKGVDGGANITALTLDMSAAGAATFNAGVTATALTTTGGITAFSNFVIASDSGGVYLGKDNNSSLRLITDNTTRLTIANDGVSTFSSTVTSTGLIANVPTNTGLTINSADVSAIQFNVAAGNQKNWGFASTLLAAGDFGLYQSTSNGGNPITAGAVQLYFTSTGEAAFSSNVTLKDSKLLMLGTGQDGRIFFDESTNGFNITAANGTANNLHLKSNEILLSQANAVNHLRMVANTGIIINEGSENLDFRVESDNYSHALFVDGSNGRVNIGDATTPAAALHISTNAATTEPLGLNDSSSSGATAKHRVSLKYQTTEVGSIKANNSATTFNTSSDQRLKENIADADNAGSKIDAIQVRQFDWKVDGSHQDYGMVAQELIEVAPEAVARGESQEEMMGVDYSKLVPMLVKEIQSLRNRVEQLENS